MKVFLVFMSVTVTTLCVHSIVLETTDTAAGSIVSCYKPFKTISQADFQVLNREIVYHIRFNNCEIHEVEGNTFYKMANLKILDLHNNNITHLETEIFQNTPQLEQIYLRDNRIEIIKCSLFNHLYSLHHLNLGNNKISYIGMNAFKNLIALKSLYLNNNKITTFPDYVFHSTTKLLWLDLSYNKLREIKQVLFSKLTSLEMLYLHNNQLKHISPNSFSALGALKNLSLGCNSISTIEAGTFDHNTKLEFLWIHGTNLHTIQEELFYKLTNLKWLQLYYDKISQIGHNAFPITKYPLQLVVNENNLENMNYEPKHNVTENIETTTEEKLKEFITTKPNGEEISILIPPLNEEDKATEKVLFQVHSTTTEEPEQELATRPPQFKRLTPSPVEISTIVETEDTAGHTGTTESLVNNNPEIDPCGEECRKVGARMLSRMNHSRDACDHFYDYACGGDYIENTPEDNWKQIADALDRINSRSPYVYKTFKRFYKSCVHFHMDYDYNDRVIQAIDLITSVAQSSIDNIGDKSALTDLLTQLLLHDSSPLFDISVDVDQQSQHFILQLNIGKRFSTFSDKYSFLTTKRKCLEFSKSKMEFSNSHFNGINLNEMYSQYLECQRNDTYKYEIVERALEALEMKEDYVETLEYIPKVLNLYKKLPTPAVVRKNIITRQFEIRTVAEMEMHYPSIQWKQLFKNLVGKEVSDEDIVQVYFKDFFAELFGPKTTLNTSTLHEAILGMYAHDLYTNLILPTTTSNPEEFCLKYSSDLMKEVASALFLDSIDPKNTNNPKEIEITGDLKRIEDLFSKMKSKLADMINKASWIDHITQNSMIKKLNNMEFDSWNRSTIWKNLTIVEDRMKDIKAEYPNYTDFAAALVKRNRQLLYSMWDTMAYNEENVWWHFITPYSTSPKSIYPMNRVFVPPGALLTKSEKVPKYLSLVKLGYKLAKAIAHHFDYFGSSGLTGKPKQAYKDFQDCILYSYSRRDGTEYDGKYLKVMITDDSFMLSLNDRYAEDLAITLLSTMSSDDMRDFEISWFLESPAFNREKLFFIALGQEHCKKPRWEDIFVDFFESEHFSAPLLLDNSLSQLELFSEVFECKDGSLMNPPVKCKPFPVNYEPDDDYEDEDY